MQIEIMKLADLKPADYNPRIELIPGMYEYEKLKQSILEFGFIDPPIFNKQTGNLVGGHQRVAVAKDLGLCEEIEVSVVDLPLDKEKALNVALNKISGQWDDDKLALLLKELDADVLDLSGFVEEEIQDVIEQYDMKLDMENEAIDDEFEIELPEKSKATLRDIYQLGNHRLMCGDSTNKEHLKLLMNGEKADLLITDPPYNVNYEGKTEDSLKIQNDNKSSSEFYEFLKSAFDSVADYLREGASFYVWYASSEVVNFVSSLVDANFLVKQELIWFKNSLVLGRQDYQWQHEPCLYGWKNDGSHMWYGDRKQTTILEFDKPLANKEHPTMKPIPLFDYQIKNSSKKGDKILDIFGGSGTTMIACEHNDRCAYIMELDPRYVDVIINRWEELTGKKAVKLN
ncbi:DNA modification methylase [Enterococcus faecium]|uniref:site-specific DNA-methyltransferase n=1 Tax=Enterococcus TaxID=1350 RepID=UPI000F653DFD|nr:site-specific DNA-methyltransferase [Enterococcus faecium]EKY8175566.1 DNA modification methylase [Enterococcus faecium]MDQ8317784.1 site-specific DNA-methyltransferase [Enterococcus faecium]MDQ8337125.1 site-specific DNA-methyltransferase [Enterococcus faecium]MDQ8436444.1 site-specific DNA-methyltransferase [Enterococcus faecium]MDQ8441742.1 site-specific DNA-methyltransferase [Enterococcus faecium]